MSYITPRLDWAMAFPLLSGQPIPAHGFAIVLGDNFTRCVPHSKHGLGSSVPLLSGQPIPTQGFRIVLPDAFT
jgi:hypothetical protein